MAKNCFLKLLLVLQFTKVPLRVSEPDARARRRQQAGPAPPPGQTQDRQLPQRPSKDGGEISIVYFWRQIQNKFALHSQHDMNSFTLDLTFATDRLMSFTVTGCFRERTVS